MKKDILLYTAGFFDGEGSISIAIRNRKWKNWCVEHILQISIGQKDGATLDWIKDNFGGRIYQIKRDNSYFWVATNKVALKFLKDIIPFLQYKKPQAELAIKFYDGREEEKMHRMNDNELKRRNGIYQEMKLLKKIIIKSQYAGSTTKRENVKVTM